MGLGVFLKLQISLSRPRMHAMLHALGLVVCVLFCNFAYTPSTSVNVFAHQCTVIGSLATSTNDT